MYSTILRFVVMTQLHVKETASKSRDQAGATAVEYGLLVSLIAGLIVVAVTALSGRISGAFDSVL